MRNATLRSELLNRLAQDSATRSRLAAEGVLFDGYHPDMEAIHLANAQWLNRVLDACGWPGIELVDEDGENAAWVIAMHAISDPPLQRKSLRLISRATAQGDAPAWHVAYLIDRILFNQQRPQLYGAIRDWDENGELTAQVDDRAKADQRRKEIGLLPLSEADAEMRRSSESKGERPPLDLAERNRRQREWARRVGWIAEKSEPNEPNEPDKRNNENESV